MARGHYDRALSIVRLVEGSSMEDQAEVSINCAAVLLNLAAVDMAEGTFGSAVKRCTEAMAADPSSHKALLRRAKANAARGEFDEADADLDHFEKLAGWGEGLDQERRWIQAKRLAAKAAERKVWAGAL